MPLTHALLFLLALPTLLLAASLDDNHLPLQSLLRPSDAVSLITFKSKADLDNKLLYILNERFDYCQWQGVKCAQGRVVRLVLQSFGLRGTFPPDSLSRLDQLRVLSFNNNSLSGPIPDLSSLYNLKSLFLDRNSFSGSFPPSILTLHRLLILDLSFNNFTGPIPVGLVKLDRLNSLRLELNRFNGTIPPLNQSLLLFFNVSGNNLTGPIPLTPALSRFRKSSFLWNDGLCGEVLKKACSTRAPFFESPNAMSPTQQPLGQSAESSQGVVLSSPPSPKNHKKTGLAIGLSIGSVILIASLLGLFSVFKAQQRKSPNSKSTMVTAAPPEALPPTSQIETLQVREITELPSKTKTIEEVDRVHKSGNLIFSAGEAQLYSLEQLMRASAELLGRGTIGTTYKAVLDNQLIVTVKRLDAVKTSVTSGEAFERHMEAVGGLRHANLVPVRAFFQAKGERLVIYDYQPNGSLFNLIHGKSKLC